MADWRALRDAYGSAEPVEGLLERGDTDQTDVWEELWSRLCHQGTVYSASYAALPRLAELARGRDPSGIVEPLFLATSIVASTDAPADVDVRAHYAETIRELHAVAERLVPLAGEDADFVYRVQALIATEDAGIWGSRLDALVDEELEVACGNCGDQLLIDLGASPAEVRAFDDASVGVTAVIPADSAKLTGSEARAYQLATDHGRRSLAERMLEVFAEFECPRCRARTRASAGAV
ncbi:hypothetical protein ABTZ46_22840 [Nocardioides sp. NPDC126508]